MSYIKKVSNFLALLIIFSLILPCPGSTLEFSQPKELVLGEEDPWSSLQDGQLISYDSLISILKKVESDDWENTCTTEELEKTIQLLTLLGKQGAIPGEIHDFQLEIDSQDLLDPSLHSYEYSYIYEMTPAIYHSGTKEAPLFCGGWLKHKCHQVKNFTKKHKKAIIIGAVVVVAVVTVVGITAVATAGAAAAGSAASSSSNKAEQKTAPKEAIKEGKKQTSPLETKLKNETEAFKELAVKENLIQAQDFNFPPEENGRVLGQVLTHKILENMTPALSSSHQVVDRVFHPSKETAYQPSENLEADPATNLHQLRGQRALELHHYNQAIFDFEKVIQNNPNHPEAYLNRATAHLHQGNYKKSLEDYQTYLSHKEPPKMQVIDFSYGFAKGLAKGAKESGTQMLSFAADLVSHPIDTGREIFEACSLLCHLVHEKEWETVGKTLTPEVHELIISWDTLSSQEKGELAGHTFGRLGSDIIVPGVSVKILCSGVKGTKEVLKAAKIFQNAEKTLALEALAEVTASPQSFAEATTYLRSTETASQIGTLSEEGMREFMKESLAKFKQAENYLKPYQKDFLPEGQVRNLIHQAGLPTFPRPKGIPDNYRVKIADKSGGMKYVHPIIEETYIRVMPGKPHSPFAYQQKPYISQMKNGKYLDKFGNIVDRNAPEAHIPLTEFIYIGD